jgi:hypothetical protein
MDDDLSIAKAGRKEEIAETTLGFEEEMLICCGRNLEDLLKESKETNIE